MWNDSNNKIAKIIELLNNQNTTFPTICPVCGESTAHIYMHRYNAKRGGIWIWCGHCKQFAHMSGQIPNEWNNAPFIDATMLCAIPDYLDDFSAEIDEWVNHLGKLTFPRYIDNSLIIKPYWGFGLINLKMSYDEMQTVLKNEKISFRTEHLLNKGSAPEMVWDLIRIGDSISMFFAKGKMFKIHFENSFLGAMDNGIRLGMPISEAIEIDPELKCKDNEEQYVSKKGYLLKTDAETEKVISMAIFIKEVKQDDDLYKCKWCDSIADNE